MMKTEHPAIGQRFKCEQTGFIGECSAVAIYKHAQDRYMIGGLSGDGQPINHWVEAAAAVPVED